MSLIQCPGCRTAFKVQRDALGKQMKCPKCRKRFVAESGRGNTSSGSSAGYVWAGIGILAFIGLIAFTTSDDESPSAKGDAGPRKKAPVAAVDDVPPGWDRPEDDGIERPPEVDATNLRDRVDQLLDAVQFGDESTLQSMTSFPYFHDRIVEEASSGEEWNQLDALGQNLATKAVLEMILGSDADQEFLKTAYMNDGDFTITSEEDRHAKVSLTHRKRAVDGKESVQDRSIELRRPSVASPWKLSWLGTSEIYDPTARAGSSVADAPGGSRASSDARAARRARLGTVARVPHLGDTPPARQAELDGLAAKLTDLSLTREASKARRTLEAAGKEAIPSLLNVMVGRDNLFSADDAMIVNQAVMGLRKITGQDFGFAPSANPGSVAGAESIDHNKEAVSRWFGWWARNKDSWTGLEEQASGDGEP